MNPSATVYKTLPFILFIVCFNTLLYAQQFTVKSYNYNNGLISGENYSTYQDSTNYYWICCFGGLVRFDGSSFKAFGNQDGLCNYRVNNFFEEKKNKYWICNEYDLLQFDGNNFKKVKTNLPSDIILKKLVRLQDHSILLITNKGIQRKLNDSTYIPLTLPDCKNRADNVCEYEKNNFIMYNTDDNRIFIIEKNKITFNENLPKGKHFSGLTYFEGKPLIITGEGILQINQKHFSNYLPDRFTFSPTIHSIFKDSKNRIWLTDEQDELWIFENGKWESLTEKYKTKPQSSATYFEDRNSNIVVTTTDGFTVYKESFYNEIKVDEIKDINAHFLINTYNKDTQCVGICKNGLVFVAGNNKWVNALNTSSLKLAVTASACFFYNTQMPNTKLLHIEDNGIYYYHNNALRPFCRLKNDYDHLSFGVYDSLYHCYYTGGKNRMFRIYENKIDTFDFSHIANELRPHGFIKLNGDSILFELTHKYLILFSHNKVTDITSQLGLEGKDFGVQKNKETLWVILYGKEIREYAVTNNHFKIIRTITKNDGLIDANIGNLIFDDENNIWLNCFSGVYFLKSNSDNTKVYSKRIPLQSGNNEAPMMDYLSYSQNHIYAACTGSVLDISTHNALFELKPLATYIASVKINATDLEWLLQRNYISKKDSIWNLPSQYNSISFETNTLYFGFDDAIQYQYKLMDEDKEWKNLQATNIVNYNNLPNGKYIFKIRSVNKLNHTFFTEASFNFIIQPPYWKSWWFRVLLALITIAIIYWFIKRRDAVNEQTNKIALQMSELKLTALQSQMNPHFIFNALNSIQNYILNSDQIEAARYLSKFSKLIRKTLDNSHQQLIPLEEIVASLSMYLELESFRFNNEFAYKLSLDDSDQRIFNLELPPMLLQPYVENAILHGLMPKIGNKFLSIDLYIEHDELHCVIDDNGVGRQEKTKREGHISQGEKLTQGMLESLRQLKMSEPKISYEDKKDEKGIASGTTIKIIIPLKN